MTEATPAPLACPYCTASLPDAAIRCAGCGQDVALVMPVMRRMRALEAEVATLRTGLESRPVIAAEQQDVAASAPPEATPGAVGPLLLCLVLSFAALLLTHHLATMRFDLPNILLRLASVAIPAGMVLVIRPRASLGVQALAGLALGTAATLAMSAVVAAADGVPTIPRDGRGQRELMEYAASIALAHLSGAAFLQLRQAVLARRRAGGTAMIERATTAQRLAEAAMPVTALGASLYGGLRALVD